MRRPAALAGALVFGAATLPAQHAHQVELGAFASFNRYDRTFGLDNAWGVGGRLGYFLSDHLGIEVDAGFADPRAGAADAELVHGSASLVLNLPVGAHHVSFLLAGYSRLDFEPSAPYRFTDNALHAGLGHRVLLSPRVALRLEGRAIYAPATRGSFTPTWAGHLFGAFGLSLFVGRGPDRDRDADGIVDRLDACPGTPAGAVADPRGCPADSDGDGIYNGLDTCPNSPAGALTDRLGCPLDADRDGVHDGADQCPATPGGARVDALGCPSDADEDGVPDGLDGCDGPLGAVVDAAGCPVDSDDDGVPDGLDRCPDTRAGAAVDAVGCPTARDSDGDGVGDPRDHCPRTAAGTPVDAAGCPLLFTDARTPLVLHGVTFESGRSALRRESFPILDQVAASLVANPEVRVEIAGHTDKVGGERSNQILSQSRADAVRAYLARRGVSPARTVSRGYGESQPVANNATADGRAQNRRVELRRLP